MSSPVQRAVDTYIAIASERDPEKRAALLEACWAETGRLVVHGGRPIEGRAAMLAMYDRFHADPKIRGVMVRRVDAKGTTFRFRYETDYIDGTSTEGFDAGEIDESGRITTLIAFAGSF